MDDDMRCGTCRYWGGDVKDETNVWDRYDKDGNVVRPPHARLNWGRCRAAPEGFDKYAMSEWPDAKMAVWDGSSYRAELLTRCDHICGEYKPKDA